MVSRAYGPDHLPSLVGMSMPSASEIKTVLYTSASFKHQAHLNIAAGNPSRSML